MNRVLPTLLTGLLALGLTACGTTPDPEGEQNQPEVNQPDTPEPPGQLVQGSVTYNTSPDVSEAVLAELTAGNRDFAFDLLAALRAAEGDDENLFLSPHSISLALAMAYAGAANDTRAQMAQALRFTLDDADLHAAFNALALELARRSEVEVEEGDNFTLNIVNQSWGQIGFDFEDDYLNLLAEHYGAGLRLVDFINEYDPIREAINAWVEDYTNDRIQDLLPDGAVSGLTRFILVNAIYFFGSWDSAFEEDHTSPGPFQRLDGSTVDVDLMTQTQLFGYFVDEDSVAVAMPYVGGEVSMIAFMPADEDADFLAWENSLTRQHFDDIADGVRGRLQVDLTFPKFESESDLSLVESMELLGMEDAFDDCDADFQGITGAAPCIPMESLFISDILHKSFVSIDEEGTEAAAATAVIFDTVSDSINEDPPPVVRFDRPFYYAIYDHPTDTILFLGRLVDPS